MSEESIVGPAVEIQESILRVEGLVAYFAEKGVKLNPSSVLVMEAKKLRQLAQDMVANPDRLVSDGRKLTSANASLLQLATAIQTAKDTVLEPSLVERLNNVGTGDPIRHRVAPLSKGRNVGFEILCACLFGQVAGDVVLDEQPDIHATFGGSKWGIACKAMYGDAGSVVNAVRDGSEQIERSIKEAGRELGFLVIETTNLIEHDEMMKCLDPATATYRRFGSPQHAKDFLNAHARKVHASLVGALKASGRSFDKRVRGILFVAQTVAIIGDLPPAIMHACEPYIFGLDGPEIPLMSAFNTALNGLLRPRLPAASPSSNTSRAFL